MIKLKVNGVERSSDRDPEMPLLGYLRGVLCLKGTKFGCGIELCGACTVHLYGEAVRCCMTTMQSAAALLKSKPYPTMRRLTKRWRATFAAAELTNTFAP